MSLYHVNFYTAHSTPVFEQEEYAALLRVLLRDVMKRHHILCLAWELLPTHMHMILNDLPDYPHPLVRLENVPSYNGEVLLLVALQLISAEY